MKREKRKNYKKQVNHLFSQLIRNNFSGKWDHDVLSIIMPMNTENIIVYNVRERANSQPK